jgi:hypothetical protein
MADNVTFQTTVTATPPNALVVAGDDIGGVLHQRVKISQGADGSATDVSSAAPLQVTLENHGANATAVKVDGSAVTQPISHDALTELAAAISTEVQVDVVGALPAGTNLIGKVSASGETSSIYDGSTALTPKFAVIDAASSGDNTLVAAVNPKKIRVLSLFLMAAAAVTVRFESGAGGTALSGQMNVPANGGFSLPYNPVGWFETASNTLLNLELGGAVSVDGCLTYVEV